jgi:O-methyltransferase involved in polyketide biosynthesis
LLIYLSADEAARLLATVGDLCAAGSRVAFEFEDLGTDAMREQARRTPAMAVYTALWKGGLPDAPGWLAEHGWRPEVHNRAEVTARYGRAVYGSAAGGFVTATRARLQHSAAPGPLIMRSAAAERGLWTAVQLLSARGGSKR